MLTGKLGSAISSERQTACNFAGDDAYMYAGACPMKSYQSGTKKEFIVDLIVSIEVLHFRLSLLNTRMFNDSFNDIFDNLHYLRYELLYGEDTTSAGFTGCLLTRSCNIESMCCLLRDASRVIKCLERGFTEQPTGMYEYLARIIDPVTNSTAPS